MSDSDAAKKVRNMFGGLGKPPPPSAAGRSLETPAPAVREKSDRTEQLNVRGPVGTRKRVRLLASRDDITSSEVVLRALDLYEETYGKAPEL